LVIQLVHLINIIMTVIANQGRFSRGVAISSFTKNSFNYETDHLILFEISILIL